MVVTEAEKRMVTGRRYPHIVLISIKVTDDHNITLSAPEMPDIIAEIPTNVLDNIKTEVGTKRHVICL